MIRNIITITGIVVLASCGNDGTSTQNGDTTDQSKTNDAAGENYVMENNVGTEKKFDTTLYDTRALDSIKAVGEMVPAMDTTSRSVVDTIK